MRLLILVATIAVAGLWGWGAATVLDLPFLVELLIVCPVAYLIGRIGGTIAFDYE